MLLLYGQVLVSFVDLKDDLRGLEARASNRIWLWCDLAQHAEVVFNLSLLHFHFLTDLLSNRHPVSKLALLTKCRFLCRLGIGRNIRHHFALHFELHFF